MTDEEYEATRMPLDEYYAEWRKMEYLTFGWYKRNGRMELLSTGWYRKEERKDDKGLGISE